MSTPPAKILVVYNPQASAARLEVLQRLLEKHFAGRSLQLIECSRTDMAARLRPFLDDGVGLIIAAGGDGTILDIASVLPLDGPPIGILPMGTGDVLARELDIPLNLDKAAALLAGDHAVRTLDVLRVAGRAYLISVSVGLGARSMRETSAARKKIFGKSSYMVTLLLNFFAMQPMEYQVEVDGQAQRVRASDLMAANSGVLGYRTLRWWPEVQPDDGRMDLCYLEANTGFYYLWVIFNFLMRRHYRNQHLNHMPARKSILIQEPRGLAVQGDGDWIGETPVEIRLEPGAVKVAVPHKRNKGGQE
ncbi:MAG: diacylglycerol kinase family protein [Anaerolineales bacterium]